MKTTSSAPSFRAMILCLAIAASWLPLALGDGHDGGSSCPLAEAAEVLEGEAIHVTYKWIAHNATTAFDQLVTIYEDVLKQMEATEPHAQEAHVFLDTDAGELHVRDDFANAEGLGFHLGVTAAEHFGQILQIATPGPFIFHGTVPDEMKQGAAEMGLASEYAEFAFGFEKPLPCCHADDWTGPYLDPCKTATQKLTQKDEDMVIVTYKWTAMDGKLAELKAIYEEVLQEMETNEPDTQAVYAYISEQDNTLHIRDDFKNADGVAYHLTNTAAAHFDTLLQIAIPGTFYFHGTVPADIQAAAVQMGLAAEFAEWSFGFERPYPCCPVAVAAANGDSSMAAGHPSRFPAAAASVVVPAVAHLLINN